MEVVAAWEVSLVELVADQNLVEQGGVADEGEEGEGVSELLCPKYEIAEPTPQEGAAIQQTGREPPQTSPSTISEPSAGIILEDQQILLGTVAAQGVNQKHPAD